MEVDGDKRSLSQSNSRHVRINCEVSYKEPEQVSWTSMESADSSDSASMVLFFGDKDVLKTPRVKKAERNSFELQKITSSGKLSLPVQSSRKPPLGYDPNRIPAFVFSSKPATPTDWSVNSNESLFSIHLGNNSFSQDSPILLAKSQELGKFEYSSASFLSSLSSVSEATEHTRKSSAVKEELNEALMVGPSQNADDQIYRQNISEESPFRKESNESYFRTPVESGKSVAPENSDKLADEDRTKNILKLEVVTERRKPVPQTPRLQRKAPGCKWFSCFSCIHRCSCSRSLCCR